MLWALQIFFVLDSTRPTSSESLPPCQAKITANGTTIHTKAKMYTVDNGDLFHMIWAEKTKIPFDSQATSNMFRPPVALWSQTHQQRCTSRSLALFLRLHRGGRFTVSAIVAKTMQWSWLLILVEVRRNSKIDSFVKGVRMHHRKLRLHGGSYQHNKCAPSIGSSSSRGNSKQDSGSGGRHVGCFRTFHGRSRRRRCSFFDFESSVCPYAWYRWTTHRCGWRFSDRRSQE